MQERLYVYYFKVGVYYKIINIKKSKNFKHIENTDE